MKLTQDVLKSIIAEEVNKLKESSPQGFDQMAQMQPREYEAMTKGSISQPVTGKKDPRAEHLHVLADPIAKEMAPQVQVLRKAVMQKLQPEINEFGLHQDDIKYIMGVILGL